MARMIPPTIDPEVKSNAERRIYSWLLKCEWKNCVVLHSLGLAQHLDNIFGEVDFVIVSNEGILCIEVKGGRVFRKDGIWSFTNRYGKTDTKHKGPFEQAQGNMQSLIQYLSKRLSKSDSIVRCQYACCVMTPDCSIDENGSDVIREVLFDENNTEKDLLVFFQKVYDYWKNQCLSKHGFEGGKLSNEDIERTVYLLRGDFKFIPSLSIILNRVEENLLTITDEQYVIMEGFDEAERMLVSGSAGTGKTLLALEQCKRLDAAGKKVLYLCYNKLIATYVDECIKSEKFNFDVYTLHGFMNKYVSIHNHKEDSLYYNTILPKNFLEFVQGPAWYDNNKYDVVVIDEGQDLMNTNYYQCINALIKGGVAKGIWSIYFDPNQNIFNTSKEFEYIWNELKKVASTKYTLSINCRNTRQIAIGNKMISNISQARLMKAEGNDVEYITYKNLSNEKDQLMNSLRNLKSQGINIKDIVILSPYSIGNNKCCLNSINMPADIGILRVNPKNGFYKSDYLKFYSIQSYKGLESKVIMMIDIDMFTDKSRRLLNYIGASRARTLLYIFYDEKVENERQEMLLNGALMK